MSIRQTFEIGADLIFKTFHEAVHLCRYDAVTADDGFNPRSVTSYENVEIIFTNFTEKDVHFLTFSKDIQPTDIKGIVRSKSINNWKPTTEDIVYDTSEQGLDGKDLDYTVVAYSRDPMNVTCTLLLRTS